ncbi:MAG: Nif3-like dinuclear metal center hexameric protein [Candidatus Aminicenantes bacterium]|jgi:dinuclear metal center YbgI/SA1388 family protein
MVLRDDLTRFLRDLYQYENFQDYCENGLQVEGKEKIETIVFGVSFNLLFLRQAIENNADAIIVHHGIFQQGVFKLTGPLKQKVKMLMDHGISLYGIHLPMDKHPEMGHGALLLSFIGAGEIDPFDLGSRGENTSNYTLDQILGIFHQQLHPEDFVSPRESKTNIFSLSTKYGFQVLANGPAIPQKIVIMSGGASGFYEKAIEEGADTFFGGDIKERIPAISVETQTNFINLGHYFSEKPGVLALRKLITKKFDIKSEYIEIPNPI